MIGRPLTVQDVTGNEAGLISMTFSPDGMTLASGTDEGVIILWDFADGLPIP
jgi:WD40 repeat protein